MTSLPHRRIEGALWRRQGHRTTLLVDSGRTGQGDWIGVPFGSMARPILLYLQTEAVRSGSPNVELGRSMHAWLSRMGISAGGRNYKLVSEQARRISACRLGKITVRSDGARRRLYPNPMRRASERCTAGGDGWSTAPLIEVHACLGIDGRPARKRHSATARRRGVRSGKSRNRASGFGLY